MWPFFGRRRGEVEQVRWVDKKRDSGEERRVRGGSETGGFRPQVAGLPSFSGRPPFAAGKENTVLFRRTLSPGFFLPFSRSCAQTMVSSPRVFVDFSPLYFFFFWRPLIVGRMLLSPGTYVSVSACLSHNSICACKCVCLWVCVCVFHIIYKLIYKLLGVYVYYI